MFRDEDLLDHISKNNTISVESFITSEWNLNDLENIENYGNYRYRPNGGAGIFFNLPDTYDPNDEGNFYRDNLESRTISDFVLNNDGSAIAYPTVEKNRELLFDLKECFQPFRPRSGINKLMWFNNKYIDNIRSARRPRYYLGSRDDEFKYWNSYHKDDGVERGISSNINFNNTGHPIQDAVPFVVYKEPVPTNRVVVKMQTNLSEASRGEIRTFEGEVIEDPLADINRSSVPQRWSIQYLDQANNWNTAISFNEESARRDGSPIVSWDGNVELYYGIKIPEEYKEQFNFVDYLSSSAQLPADGLNGETYLINASEESPGVIYTWNVENNDWDINDAEYGFDLLEDDDTKRIGVLRDLTNPKFFNVDGITTYRDVSYIRGIRVVVNTMYAPDTPFDLIELSPRLVADISNYALDFEITKSISNDGSGLPVGSLIASNGQVTLMNFDNAFDENNSESLIAKYLKPNVKFVFYEAVLDVNGFDKFIPLKTFYSENFPNASGGLSDINVPLRDFFFRLETTKAPQILLPNITLTAAVAILLDNIGFSNYVFNNINNENDPIIPYFFVEPDVTVGEVLNRLAVATQTAMFFDEYNNFRVMTKDYLLPQEGDREVDIALLGQKENGLLPNIMAIESSETNIFNDGKINYTTRYIQRSPSSFKQASYVDEDRTYIYKPVLLWEVAADTAQKTINEKVKNAQGYALGAGALNTNLSDQPPSVVNRQISNDIIDLGENIYFLPRFQGYLYASGEIIRYDAVEYAISGRGKEWIKNNQEYQRYVASLPFNGKMYPTGNIRIYTEPYYEEINGEVVFQNGELKSHGRAQFGTEITEHFAGLNDYWSNNANVKGINMKSEFVFSTKPVDKIVLPPLLPKSASTPLFGDGTPAAQQSTRNGIIANFLRESVPLETTISNLKTTESGTLQSSALVFTGPNPIPSGVTSRDLISYIFKPLTNDFKHFGTRMRIIGKKGSETGTQSPTNSTEYFTVSSTFEQVALDGGSGGIGVMVNPNNNLGYFFEIMSLTQDRLEDLTIENETSGEVTVVHNVIFYKVVPGTVSGQTSAVPVKLWGGIAKILVDDGKFVGQDRITNQTNPTVYDLAVEYEEIGGIRRFYLYLNNTIVAIVDDKDPLPIFNNVALFVRGSSKCMFENIYALKNNYSKETGTSLVKNIRNEEGRLTTTNIGAIFEEDDVTSSEVLRKYAVSGLIKSSYLSGIGAQESPKYDIYYEEFGTILRECAYFNIKYDQAYPAFLAQINPTLSKEKSYTVSGFRAGSYGAEFLIFNNTDKLISLDETTGNYLRISGITFTQNTSNVLSVDDYFNEKSNFSDPIFINNTLYPPSRAEKILQNIKLSRSKYGKREFSIDSVYIQDDDSARELMSWLSDKTLRERKTLTMEAFGIPHIQLGDLVIINYDLDANYKFVDTEKKFVVSHMQYKRDATGPIMLARMVEV